MKKLSLGIQDFEKLVSENCIYVDKTQYICQLIKEGSVYFLSRPRRFGKSLLISTLENLFKGEKKLFKGFYIHDKIEWQQHPVIKIDLSLIYYESPKDLKQSLLLYLKELAAEKKITLTGSNYKDCFRELIKKLSVDNRVVVLVDEYDKPIIDFITSPQTCIQIRDVLKNFYGVLKGMDRYIHFVFITGVSKFSRTSIFSDLNNLNDITMHQKYTQLLGYTDDELDQYFAGYVKKLSDVNNISMEEVKEKIKLWYNGYNWGDQQNVYNPFSILNLFDHLEFKNYWFESGTPTFLINLMREKSYSLPELENLVMFESSFGAYEVDRLKLEALLFQTGYLTIRKILTDDLEKYYKLYFPNFEVKNSFLNQLFAVYIAKTTGSEDTKLIKLRHFLYNERIDEFFQVTQSIFAGIPYEIFINKEDYYSSIMYAILSLAGISGQFELMTHVGRLDCALELDNVVYIFEFKLDASAKEGLQQIKEKKYYQKYLSPGKKIYMIGVAFDRAEKNVKEWAVERFNN